VLRPEQGARRRAQEVAPARGQGELRAAPTAKCDSIATTNDVQIATRVSRNRKGATGMKAPTAVAAPVTQPSLSGVECASPIFSSSRTCSSSARAGSPITSAAITRARLPSIPFAS